MPQSHSLLTSCALCPRQCHAARLSGARGTCGADDRLMVARAALHFWEEPPISGERGSGAVFFSGCPLHCIYCQNREIARSEVGKAITVERLADIFRELQEKGALNINLVTGTQYAPQIVEALDIARADEKRPLTIPTVWNTSGYENGTCLGLLEGSIDIYLADFKYLDGDLSRAYSSRAYDYPVVAKAALAQMFSQVGPYVVDEDGIMEKGMIVRHLMLPDHLDDSKAVVRYLYETYGDDICISLMNQYTPMGKFPAHPELERTVTEDEYSDLVDFALDLGVTNSFMQEGGTASESFIPPFDLEGV